jgi:hypothetical protein
VRSLALSVSLVVLQLAATGVPAGAQVQVRYEPPVPGAVLGAFVEPDHAYAAGHRGVDLVAALGDPVRAAAGGEVTFAGSTAAGRWVSVRHADGVVTSYGALEALQVAAGDVVTRGQILATASGRHAPDVLRPQPGLHWSARRGEVYLDPLALLDAPLPRPTLVGEGGWEGIDPVVDPYEEYAGGARLWLMATPTPKAERPGYARPPNHHHLLQVPGYGTTGPRPVLDPTYLGYGPEDSSNFSYRGCEPVPTGCEPRPYGGQDTDVTVEEAAVLLDAQLRALQRAQPHRPVDLLGHSMGGDVIAHYLSYVYDPEDPQLPPIGNMATIATPHGGSGSLTPVRSLGEDPIFGNLAELARLGLHEAGVDAAGRVSLGSAPLARYGAAVLDPRPTRDLERLEELGIGVLEIAGSRDLIVGRTDAGAVGEALVLPGGHHTVTDGEATYATVHDFLGGGALPEVGSRVGWGTDAVSDAGRTLGTVLDLWPARSVARALEADDAAGVLWEVSKDLLGGPASRPGDAGEETPMAPDAPLTPLERLS